jgi:transposase
MSVRFVNIDRETPMLLPPDLREWVSKDDLAHFILEAMEGVESNLAAINHRGSGSEQYPPAMMMALLLYSYASGIFSSRRIEGATRWHVAVRYLAGNTHPDHDTIATFRRVNKELVRGSFVRVLELAREVGLLRVGTVAVDGTKVWANAAKRATLSAAQVEQELGFLQEQVEELLTKAEAADAQEPNPGESLPRELTDRAQRRARLEAARLALEEKAQERTRAAARERERAQREGGQGRPPVAARVRRSDKVNTTDPQSALQPTAREGFIQGYNAQAAVSVESGLIVAAHVVSDTGDRRQLAPTIAAIPAQLGPPQAIIADTGYDNTAQILEVERTTGASVYCALQPPNRKPSAPGRAPLRKSRRRQVPGQLRQRMKARLQSAEGVRLYRLRKTSIEPVFGIIKSVLGFRRFGLRGLEKVNLEWQLVGAAFNCRRIAARRRVRR